MDTHLAYLAGIMDGEGTITIYKHQQHGRATYQLRPRLIVSNTDMSMLVAIRSRHGGSIALHRPACDRQRAHYVWRLFGMEAMLDLVLGMRPYLITKAERADLLVQFLRSRLAVRDKSFAPPYTDSEFELYETLRSMNLRGVVSRD